MSRLPCAADELAEQVRAFAASIENAKSRWLYCLSRVKQTGEYRGEPFVGYAARTVKASQRLLGNRVYVSGYRYQRLDQLGYDEAVADAAARGRANPYTVGPLEAWHLGHVYFARVVGYPHVVKIGFSRRVRERLEDVESKNKTSLSLTDSHHLKVGSILDEHWWHHNWRRTRIEGEWFFDPFTTERSLPPFLSQTQPEAAHSESVA